MRRALGVAMGLLLPMSLVAGCSDDPPRADLGSPPALWNPCDGLDVGAMDTAFSTSFNKDSGTAEAPVCTFTPQDDGEPAVDANYMVFDAGLDAAWDTMGTVAGSTVDLDVAGADAARMVVHFTPASLLATGFVQNGDLIQIVNVVDPAPFERDVVRSGMTSVLTDLSAHAATKGLE